MIDISLDKKIFNEAYLPYMTSEIRTQIFFGGSSSGKSFAIVGQRTIYDILQGKRNYLILRNVAKTSRASTFNEVMKCIEKWELKSLFKINASAMTITCINGRQIMFMGLDDVEKIKSTTPLKGVLTDILIEEATEVTRNDVKHLNKRLRGLADVRKRLTMLFNPILKSHWIYRDYFKDKFFDGDTEYLDEENSILKTTYKDNLRFLEADDAAALENETDKYFYDVYTLGNWGVLGGTIFRNWSIEDLSEQMKTFDNIRCGLDFGFSNDPAAIIRLHVDNMRKMIFILQDGYFYGLTNPELAEEVKLIAGDDRIVCDSAEPKSIEELVREGVYATAAIKGKDSVRFGIQFIQQFKIVIHQDCLETINEFSTYQWLENRRGEKTGNPEDKNNHLIDAMRYALEDDAYISSQDEMSVKIDGDRIF